MDFRSPAPPYQKLKQDYEPLNLGRRFDLNFVLNVPKEPAALAYDPISERFLEVVTSEPRLQFYSWNFLDQNPKGKNGIHYRPYGGFYFETQHLPHSRNYPELPSAVKARVHITKIRLLSQFSAQ